MAQDLALAIVRVKTEFVSPGQPWGISPLRGPPASERGSRGRAPPLEHSDEPLAKTCFVVVVVVVVVAAAAAAAFCCREGGR